jgi:hypothetical protein
MHYENIRSRKQFLPISTFKRGQLHNPVGSPPAIWTDIVQFSLLEKITRESACGIYPSLPSERLSKSRESRLHFLGAAHRAEGKDQKGKWSFLIRA